MRRQGVVNVVPAGPGSWLVFVGGDLAGRVERVQRGRLGVRSAYRGVAAYGVPLPVVRGRRGDAVADVVRAHQRRTSWREN